MMKLRTANLNGLVALSIASLVSMCAGKVLADDDSGTALKGAVDETAPLEPSKASTAAPIESMPMPVVPAKPKKLQGGVQQNTKNLNGEAADDDERLTPMKGQADSDRPLKGSAMQDTDGLQKEDPDAQDQELMVQWDKWRNRFLWAIQSSMQEFLNNPDDANLRWDPERQVLLAKFPLGTVAWFSCHVTSDRHIESFKLLRSSGYPNYDKAVANAVRSLEGTSILKFPAKSRRPMVTQIAGIKTSEQGERQYFKFGDTERYTVPGGQ
jgi:hypothetical protein